MVFRSPGPQPLFRALERWSQGKQSAAPPTRQPPIALPTVQSGWQNLLASGALDHTGAGL